MKRIQFAQSGMISAILKPIVTTIHSMFGVIYPNEANKDISGSYILKILFVDE